MLLEETKKKLKKLSKEDEKEVIKYPKKVVNFDYTFNFGRYSGWRFYDIARKDFDYILWLLKNHMITIEPKTEEEMIYYIIYNEWHSKDNQDDLKDKIHMINFLYKEFIANYKNILPENFF